MERMLGKKFLENAKSQVAHAAMALPLLSCMTIACGSAHASPAKRPEQQPKAEQSTAKPKCTHEFDIGNDEKVIDRICRPGKEFVLTDKYLRIYFEDDKPIFLSPTMEIKGSYEAKKEIANVLAPGLAAWVATERYCYFLAKNGELDMIPNKKDGPTYSSFAMPFPTTNITKGKMFFHSGFLFIAGPYGDTGVVDEATKQTTMIRLPPTRDAAFFTKGDRLFYGINGFAEAEIRINGPSVQSINVMAQ